MQNKQLSLILKSLKPYENFLQNNYASIGRGIDEKSFFAEQTLIKVLNEIGCYLKIPNNYLTVPFFGDIKFFNKFNKKEQLSPTNEILIFEAKLKLTSPFIILGIPEKNLSLVSEFLVGGGIVLNIDENKYISKSGLYKFLAGTIPLAQLILYLSALKGGLLEN